MNPVLATPSFWKPYFMWHGRPARVFDLESADVTGQSLAQQLDALAADFPVRERTVTFQHGRRTQQVTHRHVEFPFSCGERFTLLIDYEPRSDAGSKTLYLLDPRSGGKHQFGWWDLARPHPYCLRPEELDALLVYWTRHDPRWTAPELPLLLLCHFVGLADPAAHAALSDKVETACRRLRLPRAADGAPTAPLEVADNGSYRWDRDAELGHLFTSDDYPCYSLRNRPHAGGEEGLFPFGPFQEMMADLALDARA